MRIPKVSPEMMDILKRWEIATARIEKLQGEHIRRIYDSVFAVEKVSIGKFYFEAPNKGRMDIEGPTLKSKVSARKDEAGKPYKLEPDRPEIWICDGKFLFQVNESQKLVEGVRLPEKFEGNSIVDAQLPFLFGMPAEKAVQRYVLAFSKDRPANWPKHEIWLDVKPRLPRDAAEWSSAKVILDTETFLPHFVKLIDPSGNLETVYTFSNCKINKIAILPWNDPFKPPRIGYKYNIKNVQPAAAMANNVPSAIGMTYAAAEQVIKQSGYEVDVVRGTPAKNPNLKYVVYEQSPGPRKQLNKGETVTLTVYDAPLETRAKPPIQQIEGQRPVNE
ncbi:MAG: PASTA domain-containing protein [Planctomycetaceae bacterium]